MPFPCIFTVCTNNDDDTLLSGSGRCMLPRLLSPTLLWFVHTSVNSAQIRYVSLLCSPIALRPLSSARTKWEKPMPRVLLPFGEQPRSSFYQTRLPQVLDWRTKKQSTAKHASGVNITSLTILPRRRPRSYDEAEATFPAPLYPTIRHRPMRPKLPGRFGMPSFGYKLQTAWAAICVSKPWPRLEITSNISLATDEDTAWVVGIQPQSRSDR